MTRRWIALPRLPSGRLLTPVAGLSALWLLFLMVTGAVRADVIDDLRSAHVQVTPQNFDSGGAVSRQFHLNVGAYLDVATINHVAAVSPLRHHLRAELASAPVQSSQGAGSFADYVAGDDLLDGVVILHKGALVFEAYPRMAPWQRHFAWSVSKVVASTALAILVDRGQVDMTRPVDDFVPALKGSAWEGVSLRNLVDNASGIDCLDDDGYQNTDTCVYQNEESLGITAPTGRNIEFLNHLKTMTRHRAPGEAFEYVSVNTNVLALVVEAVTGQSFPVALQNLIWRTIGAEADALMAVNDRGFSYASGGISARLRDIARFGQLYIDASDSTPLTAATIQRMETSNLPVAVTPDMEIFETFGTGDTIGTGWQWDYIWRDGGRFKSGYSGQGLYVDPSRQLVIAWFGTSANYDEDNNEMLPVTRQLLASGLFDLKTDKGSDSKSGE